ncbi:MAG: HAMP domain-containing histidine kinase [Clostridia bacterium]|nr:HAMP domain-containing histidine kinase [Clostridia bacterium]
MDNTNAKDVIMNGLKTSLIIFILLEIVIIYISNKLTKWIIKPVEETFDKQKQFIADASHELKTPLAVIIASSEALENNPTEVKWIDNIKSESERMNNLITELLEMAKSENGMKEQYVIENISKIVERGVLTFESFIYEKNIKLDYEIQENITLSCNSSQMKQLVSILIDNSIKHCTQKGEIIIKLKQEKGNIIFTVTNTGKEIPKEAREKIFERFYRIDESRNRNENRYGLGLAIAKNIVTNHNGTINVNCENGYTTFKVILKNV